MSEFLKKELGAWILIITGAFGTVLLEYIILLGWSVLWVTFIGIAWYTTDILVSSLVWHYLKVRRSNIPVILTEVDDPLSVPGPLASEVNNNTDEVPEDPKPDIPDSALSG